VVLAALGHDSAIGGAEPSPGATLALSAADRAPGALRGFVL
jgi:hypothetical protein